jgi:hypothetical protein
MSLAVHYQLHFILRLRRITLPSYKLIMFFFIFRILQLPVLRPQYGSFPYLRYNLRTNYMQTTHKKLKDLRLSQRWIFWDISRDFVESQLSFGWNCSLHLQCRRGQEETNVKAGDVGFFFGLFFDTEDVGDLFLRNVGWFSTDYMALYTIR